MRGASPMDLVDLMDLEVPDVLEIGIYATRP
jgi:hypothetical protein